MDEPRSGPAAQPQGRGAAAADVRRTQRAALPHAGGEQGGNTPPSRAAPAGHNHCAAPAGHNHCAAPAGHRHRTNQGGSVRREGQQTKGGCLQTKGGTFADQGGTFADQGGTFADQGGQFWGAILGAILGAIWGLLGGNFGGFRDNSALSSFLCGKVTKIPYPSPVLCATLSLLHCDTMRGRLNVI